MTMIAAKIKPTTSESGPPTPPASSQRRRQRDHHAEQRHREVNDPPEAEVAQHRHVAGDQHGEAGDHRHGGGETRRARRDNGTVIASAAPSPSPALFAKRAARMTRTRRPSRSSAPPSADDIGSSGIWLSHKHQRRPAGCEGHWE